jgi:hypothetical protein
MLLIYLLYVFGEALGTAVFLAFRSYSLKENLLAFDTDMFLYVFCNFSGMYFYISNSSRYECLAKFAIQIIFLVIYIVASMKLFQKRKLQEGIDK